VYIIDEEITPILNCLALTAPKIVISLLNNCAPTNVFEPVVATELLHALCDAVNKFKEADVWFKEEVVWFKEEVVWFKELNMDITCDEPETIPFDAEIEPTIEEAVKVPVIVTEPVFVVFVVITSWTVSVEPERLKNILPS
jgi:hypothetical protein